MPPDTDDPYVVDFSPRAGAVIDIKSLQAIADIKGTLLSVMHPWLLESGGEATGGLVLSGLRLIGSPADNGPPGAVEPNPASESTQTPSVLLTGGSALVPFDGELFLCEVGEEHVHAEYPPSSADVVGGSANRIPSGDYAVVIGLSPHRLDGGTVTFARRALRWSIEVIDGPELDANPGRYLCLARAIPATRRYETDLSALWQPEDPRTRWLLRKLEELETHVWRSTPSGTVWSSAVLGREWLRYQSAAAAALQAAGMSLATRPMTTAERVRILEALYQRLMSSVSEAGSRLLRLFGGDPERSPYGRARARMTSRARS